MLADHFAAQEMGERKSLDDITTDGLVRQNRRASAMGDMNIPCHDAVSILDYGHSLSAADKNKAVGLDGLALSLATADERSMIRLQYPLILKQSLCISEPIQAKGGELIARYKSGLKSKVSNHRSLMLGDGTQKCYHGAIRRKVLRTAEAGGLRDQACTGRRGRGADFAALGARAFIRTLKHKNWCGGLLFWDLVAAYHRVIRCLVFGKNTWCSDEEITHVIKSLELPPSTIEELVKHIDTEANCMNEYGASDHLTLLTEEAHTTSFVMVNGATQPHETHRGGRPGNPFADMVHQFLLAKSMRKK